MTPEVRIQGIVKSFDDKAGYGFISVEGEDRDIFCHYTGIRENGHRFKKLLPGSTVEFVMAQNEKGKIAQDVVMIARNSSEAN